MPTLVNNVTMSCTNKLQETLEEAAIKNCESITHPYFDREKAMFIKGAKWQQEQDKKIYSEAEVLKLLINFSDERTFLKKDVAILWFEQFKKTKLT